MVVRGPTLSLRYAREEDAPVLFELGRDPDVTRFFSWGPYREEAQARRYIEDVAAQRQRGERLEFVIANSDDRPIGVTGFSEFSLRDRRAIVGTWFGKPYWGTGANAESKALVLAVGFRSVGLQRATALTSPDNERSLRALEKIGFVREGVLRAWQLHRGEPRDCTILRLLCADWENGPLADVAV